MNLDFTDLTRPPEEEAPAKEDGVVVRAFRQLGPKLAAIGVKADHVTLIGLLAAALTGTLIALGHFYAAVVVGVTGCLMDTLDGAVAKAAGTSSKRGAFFDSVSDRVADMFIFGGVAWYFAGGPGRDPQMALVPFAILGVSNTISYERAKAESLGYVAKGGLMERAERLIGLGIILLLSALFHIPLVPMLLALLGLCVLTALQRFFKVWNQASAPEAGRAEATVAGGVLAMGPLLRGRHPARVESRWRAWRDARSHPEAEGHLRRVTLASRSRSRRRQEPLSIRLRQAFQSERTLARSSTPASAGAWRARSARRRQDAASSFRRRIGSGR
jgi:CDP-diacylglycerol---glycerol-3-phosphate 3-phosphatidyltransferase